jgi:hypothetical protein
MEKKKKTSSTFVALLLVLMVYGVFYFEMPQSIAEDEKTNEFSTQKALYHIKIIAEKPHYVSSPQHEIVGKYIVAELQKLGLEPTTQEGFALSEGTKLTRPKNIIAKINGKKKGKALLLLSHYDSAPHSYSHGASDDGSGVATVLEGVRVFLNDKNKPENDVIILFTDAEEFGLNGASLFVNEHSWAKNVGLVINFEARGTEGPSYMLMETNQGNGKMVKAFTEANPRFPVSNSLMYSVYKMLPNDTDLTVFREQGKIQGFNFAFIDNHFNYHTAQDDFEHVSPTTIAHQGSYLMALLQYFSSADLSNLNTTEDYVYFNTPFKFIIYPFAWIETMLIIAIIGLLILIFIGIKKRLLDVKEIAKGFLPLFGSLLFAGGMGYFLWKLLLLFYPQYQDILQGFTYNGHLYILTFAILSIYIALRVYQKWTTQKNLMNHFIAPLLLWIILNILVIIYLKGAAFLIVPVFTGLLMLTYFVVKKEINIYFNLAMATPTLIIIVPLIKAFPIGLGLKILFVSCILVVLCFSILLPVFESFLEKRRWKMVLMIAFIGCLIDAHYKSDYQKGMAKPNSLVYLYNADVDKSFWATYDLNLDSWTKSYLGENPEKASAFIQSTISSKYDSSYTFMAEAPKKDIKKATVEFIKDSIWGKKRFVTIKITPNRNVNRFDVFVKNKIPILDFKANGVARDKSKYDFSKKNVLLSYLVVDNIPLVMSFQTDSKAIIDLELQESSFDLLSNPLFSIAERSPKMMPKPFVVTDAIIVKQKIKPSVHETN